MAPDLPLFARAGNDRAPYPFWTAMRAALAILLIAPVAACDLPRDPHGTLESVQGGTLRAGLVAAEPDEAKDLARLEAFAASLNAELQVRTGGSHDLVEALENGELDLVASLPKSTPFATVGFSAPFDGPDEKKRVWAVRPGENGFLLKADRFLAGYDAEEGEE